jgi:hypothetical protein
MTVIVAPRAASGRFRLTTQEFRRGVRGALATLLLAAAVQAQQPSPPAGPLVPVLPELKHRTQLPILLPTHLPALLGPAVYATAEGTPTSYTIHLESDPDCHQADVCFVGELRAKKGGELSYPDPVQIDKVIQGRYQPATCDSTCSPPAIEWKMNGVLYTAQLTLRARNARDQRSEMLQVADSATRSGAR